MTSQPSEPSEPSAPSEPPGSAPANRPADSSLAYEPPDASAVDRLAGYQVGPPEPGAQPPPAPPARLPRQDVQRLWAVLGECERRGTWQVPAQLTVTALLGEIRLDLREAQLSAGVTTIEVRGLFAEVRIIVPDGYRVECAGSAILGEFADRDAGPTRPAPAGAPLIRVVGAAVLSEVRAYRTAAPVGQGRFAVDGLTGLRHRLRRIGR